MPPRSDTACGTRTIDLEVVDRVCHDLRSPISVVNAFAELLEDEIPGSLNAEQRVYVSVVRKNLDKLNELITDLYESFEAVSSGIRLEFGAFDLEQLLDELAEEREADCRSLGMNLYVISDGPLVHPNTDGRRLKAALGRLVDNALRFASQGGELVLRLTKRGGRARVEVGDRGPGIPEDALLSIFDCIYRLDRDGDKTRGIGVGLTICRATVEALGGKVWAENGALGGTTFVVELPLQETETADEVASRAFSIGANEGRISDGTATARVGDKG